jgi:hypothetical protein
MGLQLPWAGGWRKNAGGGGQLLGDLLGPRGTARADSTSFGAGAAMGHLPPLGIGHGDLTCEKRQSPGLGSGLDYPTKYHRLKFVSQFWGLEVWDQGVHRAGPWWGLWGRMFQASPRTPSGLLEICGLHRSDLFFFKFFFIIHMCIQCLGHFSPLLPRSDLCFRHLWHSPCMRVFAQISPFCMDASHIGLGPQPTPVWPYLNWLHLNDVI